MIGKLQKKLQNKKKFIIYIYIYYPNTGHGKETKSFVSNLYNPRCLANPTVLPIFANEHCHLIALETEETI